MHQHAAGPRRASRPPAGAGPAPPPETGEAAWNGWTRRGVTQFRLLHGFLPRFREVLDQELPGVTDALVDDGALRAKRLLSLPASLTGGPRPGDDRFAVVTGRRPMMEATLARLAAATPGVEIRRGGAVRAVTTRLSPSSAIPHVTGVVTDGGEQLPADLVVDASGRRSPLPSWLVAAGTRAPIEERDDEGFVYYCRHFRSSDGSVPPMMGPPIQPYESVSLVALPADRGTWGVGIVASAKDRALRKARHPDVWSRIVKSYPLVAHWLEGQPITDIDVMARIEDRHLDRWVDDQPVATGVVAVADAWAATNPSVGRGASIGLLHAVALRDVVRDAPAGDPYELARLFRDATAAVVEPLFGDTRSFDRHRIAEIDAQIEGRPYEPGDPGWEFGDRLRGWAASDPDLLRAAMLIGGLLERGVDVLADPAIRSKLVALGPPPPPPGLTRDELVAVARP